MVEFRIPAIDRHFSFESFVELNLCPGEVEALSLGRDLEAATVPLHDAGRAIQPPSWLPASPANLEIQGRKV
jgi:hypothetical protein